MATNFKLKRSSVASKRPGLSNLELGELALNTYDGFLFTERNGLGITTVANITPWYENYGAESIFYTNRVGIGTTAVPATNQLLVKGGTETDRLNTTGVSTFHDNVRIVDTKSLLIGDHTNGDLSFVHDGNNSVIRNRTGDLYVSNASQNYFQLVGSTGAVKVNHGGNLKLETTSNGVTVTGTVAATSYTGDGSSLTGIAAGITTEAASISGITTYLDLTKDDHELVVTGTNTISVIGGAQGTSHTLRLQNSGIATITLDSTYFKFASGAAPAFPITDGAISLVSFTVHKAGEVGVNTVLLSGASVSFS